MVFFCAGGGGVAGGGGHAKQMALRRVGPNINGL